MPNHQSSKSSFFLVVAAMLLTTFTLSYAEDMSPAELEVFKASIKQGCIQRGIQYKDPNAEMFCSCIDKLLRSHLTDNDFQAMKKLGEAGKRATELPAMKALAPKFKSCKVG